MTTTKKPLTCGICHEDHGEYRFSGWESKVTTGPFFDGDILVRHKQCVHPAEYKAFLRKRRLTRDLNLRAKADAKTAAEARMEAASERLVEKETWSGPDHPAYAMLLTYQAYPDQYNLHRYRRPTPAALANIQQRERDLDNAKRQLETAKAAAWATGTPISSEDILAARAAGEVTA